MNLSDAQSVADEIVEALRPACLRIEVAGSIRRCKPEGIKDVEVIAISRPRPVVFGTPPVLPLVKFVRELRAAGRITYRLDKLGREAHGDKYQRLEWDRVALDLFIVQLETWGMAMVIRTGPAEFSHRLVSTQAFGGAMPIGYFSEGHRLRGVGNQMIDTPEEGNVFEALGLPWLDPPERTEARLMAELRKKLSHEHAI